MSVIADGGGAFTSFAKVTRLDRELDCELHLDEFSLDVLVITDVLRIERHGLELRTLVSSGEQGTSSGLAGSETGIFICGSRAASLLFSADVRRLLGVTRGYAIGSGATPTQEKAAAARAAFPVFGKGGGRGRIRSGVPAFGSSASMLFCTSLPGRCSLNTLKVRRAINECGPTHGLARG